MKKTQAETFDFRDFVSHLSVFRKYLIVYLIVIAGLFVLSLNHVDKLMHLAYTPFREVGIEALYFNHIYTPFLLRLNICLMVAIFVGFPVAVILLSVFLRRTLFFGTWIAAFFLGIFIVFLFLAGAVLSYNYALPCCLNFFLSYATEGVSPIFDISVCVKVVTTMVFMGGFIALLPILIIGLVLSGVFSLSFMHHLRKYIWVGAFLIGAFLTPPDVISQCIVGGIFIITYEIGMGILYLRKKYRNLRKKCEDILNITKNEKKK